MDTTTFRKTDFTNKLISHIVVFQHLTQMSDAALAEAIGLDEGVLSRKLSGQEDFTAWEMRECAEIFGCSYEMLLPDIPVLYANVLWSMVRTIPNEQLEEVVKKCVGLVEALNVRQEPGPTHH